MKKLTNAAKDALVSIRDILLHGNMYCITEDWGCSDATLGLLCEAKCLDYTRENGWVLTTHGEEVVLARCATIAAQRSARNRAAQARGGVLRDLGMIRTAYGWE